MLIIWKDFNVVTFGKWFPNSHAVQIAMFHTFFNVLCTLVFFPFTKYFVKVATLLIKDDKKEVEETVNLDERMLSNPAVAIDQTRVESLKLADVAMNAFLVAYDGFKNRTTQNNDEAHKLIEKANSFNRQITNYLINISANCGVKEETDVSNMHNNLGDIMRIAEIADNFTKYATTQVEKDLTFSPEILEKVHIMVDKIKELFDKTKQVVLSKDASLFAEIDNIEESIDDMRKNLLYEHIERLNSGKCKAENSGIFINLVSNLERLGDHLTYIAYTAR